MDESWTYRSGGATADSGREQLLQAGAALLEQASAAASLRALTVRSVTKKAGLSTGAFYHYWETQADYVQDLTARVLEPTKVVLDNPVTDATAAVIDRPVLESILHVHDDHVTEQSQSGALRNQMLFWSMADAEEAMAGLRKVYDTWQATFSELYRQILEPLGLTVRAGLSWDHLAIIVGAVTDGVALHRRFDPEAASTEIANALLMAVLSALITTASDRESMDDLRRDLSAKMAAPATAG